MSSCMDFSILNKIFSDFVLERLLILLALLALLLLQISFWFSGACVSICFRFALGCIPSWEMQAAGGM